MVNRLRWSLISLAAAAMTLSVASLWAADASGYQNYDDLTSSMRELVGKHPQLARLEEIGKTAQGRGLWVMEVANPSGTPVAERPALFVAANFEGDQLIGSQLALDSIRRLLGAYPSDESVKRMLDAYVVYFLPRANPDGAEQMFAPVRTGSSANLRPFDDDNDGRVDEDGPEDLNGDGFISVMRVKDPEGTYMIHPDDSRLMKKADPAKGEVGEYKIFWEGIDNDGDGFLNEDPPGGVDLNRNFQHQYPYFKPEAGPHMVSEPEARAVLDWILKHRNIAIVLTYGGSDNLITAPDPKGKLGPESLIDLTRFADQSFAEARNVGMFDIEPRTRFRFFGWHSEDEAPQRGPERPRRPPVRPEVDVNAQDIPYFKAVSDKYRQVTGLEKAPAVRTPAGAFFQYGYFQFGVLSLSTPGWGLTKSVSDSAAASQASGGSESAALQQRGGPPGRRFGGGGPGGASGDKSAEDEGLAKFDVELLRWMDDQKIDGFIPWQEFQHPEKGKVEIGGFRPYAVSNPPADRIPALGEKQFEFLRYLSTLFPKVAVAESSVTGLGGGLFRVKAEVENTGFLPTALAHGVVAQSVKPTMVQLGINPENLVSGSPKTSFFQALAGSGHRQKFDWIIRGEPGSKVNIRVVSQKGGSETVTLTLQ